MVLLEWWQCITAIPVPAATEEVPDSAAERPVCFVISPIGKDGSDIRARADRILKYVISPVADDCGYTAIRADQISEPGLITTQVINHILSDPMVVADLTGENANVFYELAVRHAIRKPFVQIIEKGERIPFDVAGLRTIEIDNRDLESVSKAKDEMKRQMLAARETSTIESPISVAVNFDRLRRSDNPVERQIADVHQTLVELKNTVESRLLPARILPRATRTDGANGPTWVIDGSDFVDSALGKVAIHGLAKLFTEGLSKIATEGLMQTRKPEAKALTVSSHDDKSSEPAIEVSPQSANTPDQKHL